METVLKSMAELQRGRQALEEIGQFLHCDIGRIVVGGLTASLRVLIAECLFTGERHVLSVGVEILLKVARLRRQGEYLLSRRRRNREFIIKVVALVGPGRGSTARLVARLAVRLNLHEVMSRLGSGEVESEGDRRLLLVCLGKDERREKNEQPGSVKRAQHGPQ